MVNQTIRIERILVTCWGENDERWKKAEKICAELQKEINKKCPQGYKYKETISFEKDKDYSWIEAIVVYEQIPR